MSRGPGRMMRAALAELAERDSTSPYSVAQRCRHEQRTCWCASHDEICTSACWEDITPTRSELSSACRALHALADRGVVTLEIQTTGIWPTGQGGVRKYLLAKRCLHRKSAKDATLRAGAS